MYRHTKNGSQNQELVVKFGPFVKVRALAHLNMDFNIVPTDKLTFVCDKYTVAMSTASKEVKDREAELLKGSKGDVEWVGTGKIWSPQPTVHVASSHLKLRGMYDYNMLTGIGYRHGSIYILE